MRTRSLPLAQQRGAATLIVAIILLLALTLATFSAARIGVSEQRSVANDIRAKQAFWVAQAGIEQGIAFLNANKALISSKSDPVTTPGPPPVEQGWEINDALRRWIMCGPVVATPPCGDGSTPHGDAWAMYDTVTFPVPSQQVSGDYTFALDFLVPKLQPGMPPNVNPTVIITATVQSADGDPLRGLTGADVLRVSQMVKGYDTLVGLPGDNPPFIDAPLMVAGSVTLSANISIWGNPAPNAVFYSPSNPDPLAGYFIPATTPPRTIHPFSIWSRDSTTLTFGGNAETCVPIVPVINSPPTPSIFPSNAATVRLSYGSAGVTGRCMPPVTPSAPPHDAGDYVSCVPHPPGAIVAPCPGIDRSSATVPPFFPPDVFYYIFGIGNGSFQRVENDATPLADCAGLGTVPSGFYWVNEKSCTVAANVGGNAAEPTAPITLVVNGGTFTLNAGVHFWGTVFLRGSTLKLPLAVSKPVLHGALIVDHDLTISTGNLDLVYDKRAFKTSSARAGGFAKVLGGWIDGAQ